MSTVSFKSFQGELHLQLLGSEEHPSQEPITAFKVDQNIKDIILEHALEYGNLEGFNFADCPPFDDLEQKKIRQEALRAARIAEILAQKDESELDMNDRVMIQHAEKILWQNTLIEAARRAHLAETGQGNDDPEFCADLMRQAMEFLYSPPDRELAIEACGLMVGKLDEFRENAAPEAIGEVDRFLSKYPFMIEGRGRKPEVLSKEREAEIKEYFEALCSKALRKLRHEFPHLNNDLVGKVAARYLELRGFTDKGWKLAEVGPPRIGFATLPETKTLEHGVRTIPVTWEILEGLFIHEVERHVASAQGGYDLNFPPLVVGLPGAEDAEEGMAKIYQNSWQGKASKNTIVSIDHYRYLIGSYAYGTLDGQFHNADETFRFAAELRYLMILRDKKSAEKSPDELKKEARKYVFEHIYRAFRGMPDDLVFIKDLAYLGGSVKLARFFNNDERTTAKLIAYLNRGKFDPTNTEHCEVIDQVSSKE